MHLEDRSQTQKEFISWRLNSTRVCVGGNYTPSIKRQTGSEDSGHNIKCKTLNWLQTNFKKNLFSLKYAPIRIRLKWKRRCRVKKYLLGVDWIDLIREIWSWSLKNEKPVGRWYVIKPHTHKKKNGEGGRCIIDLCQKRIETELKKELRNKNWWINSKYRVVELWLNRKKVKMTSWLERKKLRSVS